jgi:hypothetical protein
MRNTAGSVALLLVLSCGGGDQPGAPVPVEKVEGMWRKAVCEKVYGCCSAAERANNDAIGTDLASCETGLDRETTFFVGDLQTSVAAGRVAYHPEKMAKCLADLKARSCDDVKMPAGGLDVTQACEGVFEPKVASGGACTEFWDCIGGWCVGDIGGLMDHCTPAAPDGTVCDEGPECMSGICDDNKCVKRPAGAGNLCRLGTEAAGEHH